MSEYFPTFRKMMRAEGQQGYVMLLILIMSMALFIALSGVLALGTSDLTDAKRNLTDVSSLYVAEAGIDEAVFNINQNSSYTGTDSSCPLGGTGSTPVTLFSNANMGKGTYETCVKAGSISNELDVYAIGKVYRRVTDTNPISKQTLMAVVEGTLSGGYSVETGPGGLVMSNSATITNGPVWIGGYLTMSNTATIGSASSPIAVNVANDRCPSPATSAYPTICGSGVMTNPISMSNQAHIYGNVSANGQTTTSGFSNNGLVSSSGVAAPTLPGYNRAAQVAAVSLPTVSASSASCSGSQTVTWKANIHITGNVSLSNNCTIIAKGNAWIDGNLTLSNNSILETDPTVTQQAVVMVDGSSGISLSNSSKVAENANNYGFEFITFYSTAACSPGCSTVTGTDLYNSQQKTTITISNQGLAAGSTFYAMWTGLTLSNGGTIGAILAQTIKLSNSGNITFGTSTVGGTYSYDIRYYQLQ